MEWAYLRDICGFSPRVPSLERLLIEVGACAMVGKSTVGETARVLAVCLCLLSVLVDAFGVMPFRGAMRRSVCLQSTTDAAGVGVQVGPTPKVPTSAWRWPHAWPFPDDFMEVLAAEEGVGGGFSPESVEAIQRHLAFFMADGASVLEISAMSDSVLHVGKSFGVTTGVPMRDGALGESATVSVLEACGILPFEPSSFDYVVISSGIEYVENPKDLFKSVLRVLKPGGRCFVTFSSKGLEESLSPLKMWTTMNDEQKMWIAGAYYHYAGGEGYQEIAGYDLAAGSEGGEMVFDKEPISTDGQAVYCVQATKMLLPPVEETFNYTMAALAGAPNMDMEDCRFVACRIQGAFTNATSAAEKSAVIDNISKLPDIYQILKDVKEIVIPKPIKAMLATFLAYCWTNSEGEKLALKMSTGIETPSEEFWKPLGLATASMAPRDKINFLADTVTLFGKPENCEIIATYPSVLAEVVEIMKTKLSSDTEIGDVQLLAADLSCSDYLNGSSSRDRFIRFLQQAPASFFVEELEKRKAVW